MTFIARMLRYLFWLIVVCWGAAILRQLVAKMVRGVGARPYADVTGDAVRQKLVRDPVCGMHVAQELALPLKQHGEVVYFCSAECRDKYLSESGKFAASA